MDKWWKAPVLQGPENDYGDYDYLIEDVPDNTVKWEKWERKCDECGKTHKLNLVYTGYFRTMDGWDSMDSCECWKCYLKRKIAAPFKAIKKKVGRFIKVQKEYRTLKKMLKKTGSPLTKEIKMCLKKIARTEGAYV